MNNFNDTVLASLPSGRVRVGVLGAAGYTGGELIRLLLNHPEAEIVFANSESNAGNLVSDVHEGLIGDTDLRFTDEMPFDKVDVIFFCFGHGKSEAFLKEHTIPERVKIIDLAQDFRIAPSKPPRGEASSSSVLPHGGVREGSFVYGLPEIHKTEIAKAQNIANPGCFATCIQLGLLPGTTHRRRCSECYYGFHGSRSEAWRHNPFLLAQQQPEHLQALYPPAFGRDTSVAGASTGALGCRHRLHTLSWRLRPRHLRHYGGKDRCRYCGHRRVLQNILCRRRLYPLQRPAHRPQAGSEHQQVSCTLREVRQQAPYHFLHRQPPQGCRRSGSTEYEYYV